MNKLSSLLLVRQDERVRVFYFCLIFLLIGAGMAIGRSTADALFFKRYGIQNLPAMYGFLSVVFAVVSIVYAAVADRFSAERVFKSIFLALLIAVAVSWFLIVYAQWEFAYPLYFVVYEIASELLLLHGALYMGQNFETLQTKRLSPLMFGSAQIGTILGGLFVAGATFATGVPNILLAWCAILLAAILAMQRYHSIRGASLFYQRRSVTSNALSASLQEIKQGLHFTRRSALLKAASFALFFMVVAFYTMCYSLNRIYTDTFPTEAALGQFFGILTAVTSSIALLVQFLLTGRLLRRFGIKKLNIVFPVGGVITYVGLLAAFSFPVALVGSFVREVLMPAIRRPTRNLFFNALPDYIQGRARAVAVSFVLPLALATASGILIAFKGSVTTFLTIGLIANLFYVYFAFRMNREYVSELVGKLRDRLFLPDNGMEAMLRNCADEVLQELERGVNHEDEKLAYGYAKLLCTSDSDRFKRVVPSRIERATVGYQDRLIKLLASKDPQIAADYCREHIDAVSENHLKSTMLKVLIEAGDRSVVPILEETVNHENSRLAAAGILGVYKFEVDELSELAANRWQTMLSVYDGLGSMSAIALLGAIPDPSFFTKLLENIKSGDRRRQLLALEVLSSWPHEEAEEPLAAALNVALESPESDVRALAIRCFNSMLLDRRDEICMKALEDPHMEVRTTAIEVIDDGSDDFITMLCGWLIGNAGSPRAQKAMLSYLEQHPVPESVLWEIIIAKADDALEIASVLHQLEQHFADKATPENWQLLKVTLEERKKQIINLALQALERVEPKETIRMISAGVNSKDERSFANAVEALSNIRNNDVAKKLINLFEGELDQKKSALSSKEDVSAEAIFQWCTTRPDPWLRECIGYVKSKLAQERVAHV